MRRFCINAVIAGSLVAALIVAVLWFRSHRVGGVIEIRTAGDAERGKPRRWFELESAAGGLRFVHVAQMVPVAAIDGTDGRSIAYRTFRDPAYPFDIRHARGSLARLGVRYGEEWRLEDGAYVGRSLVAPHWMVLVPLCVLPALAFIRRSRRAQRMRDRLCVGCGYDVRASEGKCPECGHPLPSSRHFAASAGPA